MAYYKKVKGERCYLSPIDSEDYKLYTAWLNDPEVTENLTLSDKVITESGERLMLETLSKEHSYTIVLNEGDAPIGVCGFHILDQRNRTCEIGIFIGEKQHWGKGYGTEAIRLLMGYGIDYLNLHSFLISVYSFNKRGYKCYTGLGFKEIGTRRKCIRQKGEYHDMIYLDMLAEEFER